MAKNSALVGKVKNTLSDFRTYWNIPMPGRYMTFKEIASYAGGGIGAYFLIYMGNQLLVSSNNLIVGAAIGIDPIHMYILYIISTIVNIPLTAIRATMIDNTRNKAGKYRPYLISMGIPTAIVVLAYVWFPYERLETWFPGVAYIDELGNPILMGYVVKCAIVLLMNFLLQFFFNFFNDSYTNLIHVLSPNTQERTDVLSIKSVVYSLAPSIAQFIIPLFSQWFTNNSETDIRLYRITYPIFALIGFSLSMIVYANTQEKIVQAKTRVVQVKFIDAFKAVAKNKYFWIIALAGWLGFLEGAYGQLLTFSVTYGHSTTGAVLATIRLITGNASMWGMIIAPFAIRALGKKKVLLGINFMNIVCILAMGINTKSVFWLAFCIYFNWLFGAFEQITTPAIQADIRDHHQYVTGERVDGMFSTVQTIGNLVTLATSAVLPFVFKSFGIYKGNGYGDDPYMILDVDKGVDGLLHKVMLTLILMAAFGAFLNMVPYFFYDLSEKQQKGIIRILRIRAMFEDYGNGVTNNKTLVEAIDIINNAREMALEQAATVTKADKKADKKAYKAAVQRNEEIEIAHMVCAELVKFDSAEFKAKIAICDAVYSAGLIGLFNAEKADILAELAAARALPKGTHEEKEIRKFAVEMAKDKLYAFKTIRKHYKSADEFVQPDFSALEALYAQEDALDEKLKSLYLEQAEAKKAKDSFAIKAATDAIKAAKAEKKKVQALIGKEMDKHTFFARAARPYLSAQRLITQRDNYQHLDEISRKYEEAKAANQAEFEAMLEEQKRMEKEKAERTAQLKAEKAALKTAKKSKK